MVSKTFSCTALCQHFAWRFSSFYNSGAFTRPHTDVNELFALTLGHPSISCSFFAILFYYPRTVCAVVHRDRRGGEIIIKLLLHTTKCPRKMRRLSQRLEVDDRSLDRLLYQGYHSRSSSPCPSFFLKQMRCYDLAMPSVITSKTFVRAGGDSRLTKDTCSLLSGTWTLTSPLRRSLLFVVLLLTTAAAKTNHT